MVDPTPIIDGLYQHVRDTLGAAVSNGALLRRDVQPGALEFAITNVERGEDVLSGGTVWEWRLEGYLASHHTTTSTPAQLVARAMRLVNALNGWWRAAAAEQSAVVNWTVDGAGLFANNTPNNAQGPAVLTVSADFALTLSLEVS